VALLRCYIVILLKVLKKPAAITYEGGYIPTESLGTDRYICLLVGFEVTDSYGDAHPQYLQGVLKFRSL
jgi:hypothetical protein